MNLHAIVQEIKHQRALGNHEASGALQAYLWAIGYTPLDRGDRLILRRRIKPPRQVKAAPTIDDLLQQRAAARAAKDWETADQLRDAVKARGYCIVDRTDGSQVLLP